ncbi:winged helix-turn-helix domain-containing protein [Agromyces seonyuensis]|uniref:Winged helix-turn-helix domain-containing protein n=1 Tax=Agromyces seonyuensis TaxID=2662446 RepID=A0A6I4P0S6_9MICO|nr:crosslink repair DNA glycosylase YcaQ family protein [Agromyces seonyuensis]MWB98335.1 winged helix-turn-helix domain-containing protein [Agromyces seonyuensis]
MVDTVSPALARRIALAAQGFGTALPAAPGLRHLGGSFERLGLFQIDSVNVFERAHYLPAFSRTGAYARGDFDRLVSGRRGRGIEYWAHQAAFIPRSLWGAFEFRRAAHRELYDTPGGWLAEHDGLRRFLRDELADRGPMRAGALEHDSAKGAGGWWGWSDAKRALETMWRTGEVVVVERDRFERVYALPEQALASEHVDAALSRDEGLRVLVARAARTLGIATEADLADYWRTKRDDIRPAIRALVDEGELLPVEVPGWGQGGRAGTAYLHRDARRPRRIDGAALLSPFDPLVWFRPRTERLFDFHYRIEIYTPEPQRVFGYYTLPILLDDRVVGRVDLKSDRRERRLLVQSAWSEPGAPADLAERLRPELERAAAWQGLDEVVVRPRGDLAPALAATAAA